MPPCIANSEELFALSLLDPRKLFSVKEVRRWTAAQSRQMSCQGADFMIQSSTSGPFKITDTIPNDASTEWGIMLAVRLLPDCPPVVGDILKNIQWERYGVETTGHICRLYTDKVYQAFSEAVAQ